MRLPKLYSLPRSRSMTDCFRGYHHRLRIGDGEWYDMQNLTSEFYPVLSPRRPRGRSGAPWQAGAVFGGMCDLDGLYYILDGTLYQKTADGAAAFGSLRLSAAPEENPKQLIPFGSYLIILPDKKYINTRNPLDCGEIEASFTSQDTAVSFYDRKKKKAFFVTNWSSTEPKTAEDGEYWVDLSDGKGVLKQYSQQSGLWRTVPCYLQMMDNGLGAAFSEGDSVSVTDGTVSIFASALVVEKTENSLVLAAEPFQNETMSFTVSRKMPALDFCFEHENRLWGCRYGPTAGGGFVNEIYASKLGDFKNWNSFQGVSTDSYTASCGTEGKWTGAIRAIGYPLFFKENYLHKVYGSYPANYQIQVLPCRGVMEGCGKSLAVVNETLLYLSRDGVMRYDGSLPVHISDVFGEASYSDGVAGGYRNKYYISMQDGVGKWHLFVFDAYRGLWHREDGLCVDAFCPTKEALVLHGHGEPFLQTVGAEGRTPEERVEWMAESGVLGAGSPQRKYISALHVRLSMAAGTRVRFLAEYDSCGKWEVLGDVNARRLRSLTLPLRPKRCDHLRLRIEGVGDAKVYALVLCTEEGSELR